MLTIQNASKSYTKDLVINIPSLALDKGIYWIQGANGSGKTTLLRMIAGLCPFEGDIQLQGTSMRKQPLQYRRLLSWADAEPLYPDFTTAKDIIRFYRGIRKAPAAEVDYLIDFFALKPHLDLNISAYSSGMVKRLSLLLAFMGKPQLILLDEPLATLDAEGIQVLPHLIQQYHIEKNASFIFTSHQAIPGTTIHIDKKLRIANHSIQPEV